MLFSLLKVWAKDNYMIRDLFRSKDMKNTTFFVYSYITVCFT